MFCTTCGNPIEDGHSFCTSCGARAESQPVEAQAEQPVSQTAQPEDATIDTVQTTPVAAGQTAAIETLEQPVTASVASSSSPTVVSPAANMAPATQIQVPVMAARPVSYDPAVANPYSVQTQIGAAYPSQAQQPAKKKSKKGLTIGVLALIVIIAAAVAAYIFAIGPALKTGKEYDVDLLTTGSVLESSTTTAAGINIKGKILSDGSTFNKDYYVTDVTGSATIQLHEGSYTATILAPVLSSDGSLIQFTPGSDKFEVTESGASKQVMFTAAAMKDSDLTDDLVSQAENVALQAGESVPLVSSYATKAKDKIAAIKKAAEEAAAKKAAKEAAAKKAAEEAAAKKAAEEAEAKKKEEEARTRTYGATWYVCASDFVTMRVSTYTKARAITRIGSRQAVTYLSNAGDGWIKIRYDGKEGYVLERYISPDKNHPLDYSDVYG